MLDLLLVDADEEFARLVEKMAPFYGAKMMIALQPHRALDDLRSGVIKTAHVIWAAQFRHMPFDTKKALRILREKLPHLVHGVITEYSMTDLERLDFLQTGAAMWVNRPPPIAALMSWIKGRSDPSIEAMIAHKPSSLSPDEVLLISSELSARTLPVKDSVDETTLSRWVYNFYAALKEDFIDNFTFIKLMSKDPQGFLVAIVFDENAPSIMQQLVHTWMKRFGWQLMTKWKDSMLVTRLPYTLLEPQRKVIAFIEEIHFLYGQRPKIWVQKCCRKCVINELDDVYHAMHNSSQELCWNVNLQKADLPIVLILDPDDDVLDVLSFAFEQKSIQVVTAKTLQEANDLLIHHKVGLIISERLFSDGEGMEWCHHLQQATEPRPFVFLSAMNGEEGILEAFRLGAFDYILKPFHPWIVVEKCLQIIKYQREYSS